MAAVPRTLVAIGQVYVTGVDGIRLRRPETIELLTEIACAVFPISVRDMKIESKPAPDRSGSLITAGFLWIHQAFTAMFLSGAVCSGAFDVRRTPSQRDGPKSSWREYHVITGLADFLLGSGFMIFLFCYGIPAFRDVGSQASDFSR